jgi:hypothetical protein
MLARESAGTLCYSAVIMRCLGQAMLSELQPAPSLVRLLVHFP